MNIAIIYPSLRAIGGAENVVVWLAESLAQKGHTIVLFTRDFSEQAWGKAEDKPYKVHLLDFKKYRSTLKTNREAGERLRNALSSYRFDVVNPHNYPASLWVYYAKQQLPVFPKILLFLHNLTRNFYENVIDVHYRKLPGLMNLWERYRLKKLFRRLRQIVFGYRRLDRSAVHSADRVVANSFYTAELAKTIYGIDVQACPLGVSLESFGPHLLNGPSEQLHQSGRITMLTVARIERQKNFDTILLVLRHLNRTGALPEGFQYKVAGNGPLLNYYRRKSRRMGLESVVQFLGHVPHADLSTLYRETSFLLHIPLDEPFGLVPVEAALFKRTSVVSDHGGPAEIVKHGVTGIHVDALNPGKTADAIKKLMMLPDEIVRMGDAAYSWAMQNMTWEAFIERYDGFLREIPAVTK